MDRTRYRWYYSNMSSDRGIPVFNLFGETSVFPDVVHYERIWDRARLHDWEIPPHRHTQMAQMIHMERGVAATVVDGAEHRLEPGAFLYIPAQAVHGFVFSKGAEGKVLSFPLPVVRSLQPADSAAFERLEKPFLGVANAMLRAQFLQFAQAFEGGGAYRTELLVSLSHTILAIVCQIQGDARAAAQPGGRRVISHLDALIAQHMKDGWGPSEYASALSVSTGHLTRLCKRISGCSASRYIDEFVMTEAARLLAFTRLSVAEVGYRLGYGDPAYFSRRFRALRNETPTAYRSRFVGRGDE